VESLKARCDSFVFETHVHFPTDITLLFDALRKVIQLLAKLCEKKGLTDWRQHAYNVKHIKRCVRIAQSSKRSSAKNESQKLRREKSIKKSHEECLRVSQMYLTKACATLNKLSALELGLSDCAQIMEVENYIQHAHRQMDQIQRRVLQGEIIPHEEKVFSLFEPHTEWVAKGKAGKPVELGVRVGILEDQHQFILCHRVMEKETDDQVAVPMVVKAKQRFPNLYSCSFDKGFHSPNNQVHLSKELRTVALPRKGKLSKKSQEIESSVEFRSARYKHSAVESAINALEVHGLDVCLDHGIWGFKRYVALAVAARNIQRIGVLLKKKEDKKYRRLRRLLH
jgi:hypothetical protein